MVPAIGTQTPRGLMWGCVSTVAVDPEVNGASHVNAAFIALEAPIHSAVLQQFCSACVRLCSNVRVMKYTAGPSLVCSSRFNCLCLSLNEKLTSAF